MTGFYLTVVNGV